MIIFLILLAIFVIVSVLCIIILVKNRDMTDDDNEPFAVGATMSFVIFVMAGAGPIIVSQFINNQARLIELQAEKNTIEYHLSTGETHLSIMTGEKFVVVNYIEEAYKFNAYVKKHEYYANNPWTSWYIRPIYKTHAQSLYIDVEGLL